MRNAAATAMSGKRDSRIRVFILLPGEANARRHKYHVGREGVKIFASLLALCLETLRKLRDKYSVKTLPRPCACSRGPRPRRKKGEPRAARLFSLSLSELFSLLCSSPAACFAFDAGLNISAI